MAQRQIDFEFELITDDWKTVREFPNYSISNHGHVRNDRTGRIMARTLNQQGIVQVGFSKDGDYHKRSVAVLVAHAFIPRPFGAFDTPINLDGDRTNNSVENLMWRPRWFAVMYHKQFHKPPHNRINKEIIDRKSKQIYQNSFVCAVENGLLEKDVVLSILNRTYCWPTYQEFRVLAD